jgi:hypothetical protein
MAQFRWKGRTRDGHAVSGELAAAMKDEVPLRLRDRGITVTSVTEIRTGGEPQDPDVVRRSINTQPAMQPKQQEGNRSAAILILLVILGAAAAVSFFAPMAAYRCERAGARVDCTVTDKLLFVYPLRTRSLGDVTSVEIDSKGGDASRIVFTDRGGKSIHAKAWQNSRPTVDIQSSLASFVAGGPETSIGRSQVPSVPMIISVALLLLDAGLLALFALSFSKRSRAWADEQMKVVHQIVEEKRNA